jgi:hypothetical protein
MEEMLIAADGGADAAEHPPRTIHALCVVPPALFDEVSARWPSFDWRSAEAYGNAIQARADEIFCSADESIDVEIALFEPDHFVAWCAACDRREDSSRSRADWAAAFPRRISYAGSLEDLLVYDWLLGRSREGMLSAPDAILQQLETAVADVLDELGEGDQGRGVLDIIAYDLPTGEDGRQEFKWSFVVEWLDDEGEIWISTLRPSENDIFVALLTMGLVNGGCVDVHRMDARAPALNSFLELPRRRWTLGPHHEGLFARVGATS